MAFAKGLLWLHSCGLWQGIGALGLTVFAHQFRGTPLRFETALGVFSGGLFAYAWNKLTDTQEDQINNPHRQIFLNHGGKFFTLFAALLLAISTGILLKNKSETLPYYFIPLLLGSLYMKGPLKRLLGIKNLSISLAWGALCLIGKNYSETLEYQEVFLLFFVITGAFLNTMLFDSTDTLGDQQQGIQTLSTKLNKNQWKTLYWTLFIFNLSLLGILQISILPKLFLSIYLLHLGISYFVPKKNALWFRGFFLDGEFVLLGIFSLFF